MTSTQKLLIALGILILIMVPVVLYLPPPSMPDEPVVVTSEDTEMPTAESWETYTDDQVTFRYPASLGTTYISLVEWPPRVSMPDAPYMCPENETEIGMTRQTEVGGRTFCVTTIGEGAAGSVYTEYIYLTEIENQLVRLDFTLRAVQCANYDEPQMTECTTERDNFGTDQIIGQIVDTLRLK